MRGAAALWGVTAASALAVGCAGGQEQTPLASSKTAEARVEKVRQLQFRRPPAVRSLDNAGLEYTLRHLTNQQLLRRNKAGGLDKLERSAAASQELLVLAGIIDPKTDAKKLRMGPSLEGAYVPEKNTVFLRRRTVQRGGRLGNRVLAHELTHALEEQALGSKPASLEPLAEKVGGEKALVEGTATLSELMYARRYLGVRQSVDQLLDRRERAPLDKGVPRALATSITFPYADGGRFAQALYKRGGGSWRLVNAAHKRPPASTEQILHPEKWVSNERPDRVTIPARPVRELRPVGGGEVGELDTRITLGAGVGQAAARRAAAGWGGGRFEVWRTGGAPGLCPAPCRNKAAALLSWSWDSDRDAREFRAAVPGYVKGALEPRSRQGDAWRLDGGAVATAGSGRRSSLAFAPDVKTAKKLAAVGAR